MHIPLATYRVQLNPSFRFENLRQIIPYLSELGVSDIFASPIFLPRHGSPHGYDVVDPNKLNTELGSLEEFEALHISVKQNQMFWLQDIVPNHMAFDGENSMLMDVFERGKSSPYYDFFDIEWNHIYENMRGKVLAPFLGNFYAKCLQHGEIKLSYNEGTLSANYYGLRFSLRIESYPSVFERNIAEFEKIIGSNHPDFIIFLGSLSLLKQISVQKRESGWANQVRHAKNCFWNLYKEKEAIRQFVDENIAFFNGRKDDSASFDPLDKILSEQFFRLAFWKVASAEINYRRFFNINELISLRVEEPSVFESTHELILHFIEEGKFSGIRIDHIDGLQDPEVYLKLLQKKAPELYTVAEKIFEKTEKLPSIWPIQGTTGYDFLNSVNGLFCDQRHESDFQRIYEEFSHCFIFPKDLLYEKKRMIVENDMQGNIDNLAHHVKQISSRFRYSKDITLFALKQALVEVMTLFPVYRTYVNHDSIDDRDLSYINQAIESAKEDNPSLIYELDFVKSFLLLQFENNMSDEDKFQWVNFVMNFQQYTGPLMAKGVEDTFFYVYNRLISLNEVGGNPIDFGISAEEFSSFLKDRAAAFPTTMNTTSTHDTKRGEDVRARINVLSEIPQEWEQKLHEWSKLNMPHKQRNKRKFVPEKNEEYFLYQTLLGALPFSGISQDFIERMNAYVIKAARESKVNTNWISPDKLYEEGYLSFLQKILDPAPENEFLKSFLAFQEKIAFFGVFNSLSQTLLKITAPGVPDIYQGAELWELNLVDPDNRRPVDFGHRKKLLMELKAKFQIERIGLFKELLNSRHDGRIKLFVIYKALETRRTFQNLFNMGSFIPLNVQGKLQNSVIAFARKLQEKWVVTVVPRFLVSILNKGQFPLGKEIWGDTALALPPECPGNFENVFTGESCEGSLTTDIATILADFPVALLVSK